MKYKNYNNNINYINNIYIIFMAYNYIISVSFDADFHSITESNMLRDFTIPIPIWVDCKFDADLKINQTTTLTLWSNHISGWYRANGYCNFVSLGRFCLLRFDALASV